MVSLSIAASLSLQALASGSVEIVRKARYDAGNQILRVEVIVEPHEDNRELRIEVDVEKTFCAATRPLDGAREKRLHTIECRRLPPGDYEITATVYDAQGPRDSASLPMTVG